MITEQTILTVDDLIFEFNSLPNNYIYRGHANSSWRLESSLERVIGPKWSADKARTFEELSFERFRPKFHLYDRGNVTPESKLAWLAIMQHYGVPTRLLDFTDSPYVALYFALEAYQPMLQRDFAVYALDYAAIMDASILHLKAKNASFQGNRKTVQLEQDRTFDLEVDPFAYDIAWITEPVLHNQRLDRQGGCFLISGNRDRNIAEVLNVPLYSQCKCIKFTINKELYTGVFALLRKMNLTSKSLYGDLDGLARAIRMEMQAYSV